MKKTELKDFIKNIKEDKSFIDNCKMIYGDLPDVLKKILSYNDNDRFIENWRIVSKSEVLNPREVLQVDFKKEKLIPVIDMMDNDYLCYDLGEKAWTLFNIVDNVKFDPRKDIYEYI